MSNKNNPGRISSIYEDKQEHNTNTKRKTEEDLEKMSNDIKEIKKIIMNKNKDWLETNENTRDSQKGKTEKGKEEDSHNKIQKESRTKENIIKQKKEQYKQDQSQNKENTESDGYKGVNRNKENSKHQNYNKKKNKKWGKSIKREK